jgi:hypothetical protein
MITGRVVRSRVLPTASGRRVPMQVVQPDYTLGNVQALADTSRLWRQQAAEVFTRPQQHLHAQFAADVAWVAATNLRQYPPSNRDGLILVAETEDGVVLGLNLARWDPAANAWYLALQTTRPVDQPGYPNQDKVKGIGSELLGAQVAELVARDCTTLEMEPLDDEARAYWQRQGFSPSVDDELRMSCPDARQLAMRLAGSPHDDPTAGDLPLTADRMLLRPIALSVY